MSRRPSPASANGFTLLEMLTATAVLILLVALLVPIFSSITSTASHSSGKLEIDVLARQALDRIGRDLAQMPKREDLDYFLEKNVGNDQFAFFSSVPGVLPDPGSSNTEPASGLSLVVYRVVEGNLERAAVALTFDALSFLTYDSDGNLVPGTGITQALSGLSADNYHRLCDGVFRFELGFLLRDGTYEPLPMDTKNNPSATTNPGYREWSPLPHRFARVTVPNGPSSTIFRPLGWQDVSAIVVTLAVIDSANSARINPGGLASLASLMTDASSSTDPANPVLPGSAWTSLLENPTTTTVPEPARRGARVYQRSFYLDSPRN